MTSPTPVPVYDGDSDFCSRCHDHTGFELVDGEWLSICCGARPTDVDVEPRD